mmetsp:Transcript_25567/g.58985  ORF Transcript_25567/g.58985 Transcript_25567/m.58985 type:complete len:320 (-) Transcript_25567:418-1377(-)
MHPSCTTPYISSFFILSAGFLLFAVFELSTTFAVLFIFFLSVLIPSLSRKNDNVETRRKLWAEWMEIAPKEFRVDEDDEIDLQEEYVVNSRGMCLLASTMIPRNRKILGVLCDCHGYAASATGMQRAEFSRLVRAGYALIQIEYEGHGRSDGLLCYIPSWELLVGDVMAHFKKVTEERKEFRGKKRFLIGQSMGGALVFSLYMRDKPMWDGAILLAPMCKIADENKPPQWVIDLLFKFVGLPGTDNFIGKLPVAPSARISEKSFKLEWKRQRAMQVPTCYDMKPRLATARELLKTTIYVNEHMDKFDAPFLLIHGKGDR